MNLRRRTNFTSEDLNVLLAAGQGERAVFLPARTARQPVAESLVALANADGGALVLGLILLAFGVVALLTGKSSGKWGQKFEGPMAYMHGAVLAGFGRAIAEVGAVMIVGGNIDGVTRVMTTAIALETSKGDLPLAVGLGIVLLAIVFALNIAATAIKDAAQRHHG